MKSRNKYAEDAKVAARHVRRDGLDDLKKAEKAKTMSEDEAARFSEQVQKATDQTIVEIDQVLSQKERKSCRSDRRIGLLFSPAHILILAPGARMSPPAAPEPSQARHVAIIMDGNGRWAKRRGLPRFEGHRRGVEAVRRTVRAAIELGIPYLTVFSFSNENWSRPAQEVADLLGLLRRFIQKDLADLHARGVRVRITGERAGLSADLVALLDDAERTTAGNTAMTLIIAFNYGGRQEIFRAAQRFARAAMDGDVDLAEASLQHFERFLDAPEVPPVDLMIRTSGEKRISNFLLWQSAYAEFVFLPVLWPDFSRADLESALTEYALRDRRFGGVTAAVAS